MQVKRYIAQSVSKAMEKAANELGTQVVMVSSRDIKQKGARSLFSKSMVEVVVGYDPDSSSKPPEPPVSPSVQQPIQPPVQHSIQPAAQPAMQSAVQSGVQAAGSPANRAAAQTMARPDVCVPPVGFQAPLANADRASGSGAQAGTQAGAQANMQPPSLYRQAGFSAPMQPADPADGVAHTDGVTHADALTNANAGSETSGAGSDTRSTADPAADKVSAHETEMPESIINDPDDRPDDLPVSAPKRTAIDNMLTSFINRFTFEENEISYSHSDYLTEYVNRLIAAHIDEKLAHMLITETDDAMQLSDTLEAPDALSSLIEKRFGRFLPLSHKDGDAQRIVMFMGPSGSGKTNAIVKLSAEFALGQKRKIGIICADTDKLCGQEQLRSYADALNASFTIAYQPSELKQALGSMSDRDIIFIDPPCSGLGDSQQSAELRMVYNNCKPTDVFICFSSGTSVFAACEMMGTYQFAENSRIIITKLDEVPDWSLCINLSWMTDRPIAYLLQGQTITESADTLNIHTAIENILAKPS